MQSFDRVQEEFNRVRQADIEEYESQLKAGREAMDRLINRSKTITKRLREVTKAHGVSLEELHGTHNDEDEVLTEYLEKIRPGLLARKSQIQADLRAKAMYSPVLDGGRWLRAESLGSLLLAPDIKHFEGMEGEKGNPWLSPSTDDGRIHIGQTYSGAGTGSGCWGVGYIYGPDVANMYFYYTPPSTGTLAIQAWTIAHGYYIARANDGCFTCKQAKAYAKMSIAVHQNSVWTYGDSYTFCDIDSQNVDTYGFIDKGILLNTSRLVQSNAPVIIRVTVTVGTLAKGSGSWAEVDFKSKSSGGGELHYIWIPCVVVSYS